jgi:NAD-dependent dihydropyrimidine dehydrogenase PreA subunit
MIELVSEERCIRCNLCVSVCPMNVFDRVPDQPPVIARQEDCQTCFMCEVYCPIDALYVDPEVQACAPHVIDEAALSKRGLLGSYRAAVGWGTGRIPWAQRDPSFRLAFRRSAGER